MPVWILSCVMKLEHWQVQPLGLILSSRKWWGVMEIIHTSKGCRTTLGKLLWRRKQAPLSSATWEIYSHAAPMSENMLSLPTTFSALSSFRSFFFVYLLWFIATTCNYKSRVAGAGLPLESWCEIRSCFPEHHVQERDLVAPGWVVINALLRVVLDYGYFQDCYIIIMSINSTCLSVEWWLLLK